MSASSLTPCCVVVDPCDPQYGIGVAYHPGKNKSMEGAVMTNWLVGSGECTMQNYVPYVEVF